MTMLKIYNNNNSMKVSFVQTPDWDILQIKNREEKIKFLHTIAEQSFDKEIKDKNDSPIGIITNAIVDEIGLYILFEGLLFGYLGLNFTLLDDSIQIVDPSKLHFSSVSVDFREEDIRELLQINEKFTNLLKDSGT